MDISFLPSQKETKAFTKNLDYIPSQKCDYHSRRDVVDTCVNCRRNICDECAVFNEEDEQVYCIECLHKLTAK